WILYSGSSAHTFFCGNPARGSSSEMIISCVVPAPDGATRREAAEDTIAGTAVLALAELPAGLPLVVIRNPTSTSRHITNIADQASRPT
ncbi:MAG TPA: hypothetical protein VFD73_01290, partial [Gemmatimonadales bacterium]|nr:hypothetical protein [Gemmatimonadales bacterium]